MKNYGKKKKERNAHPKRSLFKTEQWEQVITKFRWAERDVNEIEIFCRQRTLCDSYNVNKKRSVFSLYTTVYHSTGKQHRELL
jgi:hypothetical protein